MLESVAGMTVVRAVPVLITAVLLPLAQAAGLGCQWLKSELFGAVVEAFKVKFGEMLIKIQQMLRTHPQSKPNRLLVMPFVLV